MRDTAVFLLDIETWATLAGNKLVKYVGSSPDSVNPRVFCDRPNGPVGAQLPGIAVGGAHLAVAAGVDHLIDEFGVAQQDAAVNGTGSSGDLSVAAQLPGPPDRSGCS